MLVSFGARRGGTSVACIWATASEQHNGYFVVERRLGRASFQTWGTVAGQGSSKAAHT